MTDQTSPLGVAQSEQALVSELADVAESHFLPAIKAMREALLVAREAIWSGGDTIRAITAIDAALAHPGSPARTAPESCPNCINEDDCSSVDICRAVEEVNSPHRSSAETDELPEFEDPRVQIVYEALCDADLNEPPNCEEHWEGWVSRNIVKRLMPHLPQEAPEQAAKKPAIDPKQIKAIDDFLADGQEDKGYRAFAMMRHLWPKFKELALASSEAK